MQLMGVITFLAVLALAGWILKNWQFPDDDDDPPAFA